MDRPAAIESLAMTCQRCGSRWLPKADTPAIGAGYAGAMAAIGASLLYAGLVYGLGKGGVLFDGDPTVLPTFSFLAIPIVAPAAFVSAAFTWRFMSVSDPHEGAVAGLVATIGTYLLSFGILFVVGFGMTGPSVDGSIEAARFATVFSYVGLFLTIWVTVPVGCVGGAVYERVRTAGENPYPSSTS